MSKPKLLKIGHFQTLLRWISDLEEGEFIEGPGWHRTHLVLERASQKELRYLSDIFNYNFVSRFVVLAAKGRLVAERRPKGQPIPDNTLFDSKGAFRACFSFKADRIAFDNAEIRNRGNSSGGLRTNSRFSRIS